MISRAQGKTWLERYGPMLVGVIGVFVGILLVTLPTEKSFLGEFLNALATVGAVLASLTGVSISALMALNTDVTNALRKYGHYKIVMNYAHRSVLASLLLALVAVAGFVISPEKYAFAYQSILSGVLFYALGAFYRIFSLLTRIDVFDKGGK